MMEPETGFLPPAVRAAGAQGRDLERRVERRIEGAARCLRTAREHKRSLETLAQLRPEPREIMGYLYHQVAEQWLRAILWYLDKDIPATHDLLRLLHAAELGTEFSGAIERYCTQLNAYVGRELHLLPEDPSKADLAAARHAAERIVLVVHDAFLCGPTPPGA